LQEWMTARQEKMLARQAKPSWEFVILPETSFTEFAFFQNEPLKARVAAMALRAKVDMLFSADRVVTDPQKPMGFSAVYNSVYLVRRDGSFDKEVYDKMRLVPFGENLPYFDLIPGFQESIVGIGSFTEGEKRTIFETKGFRFGALICFESTFSSMARALAQNGADFLVAMTNDAWYGLSAGAAQHHHLSLLRAVETRRWVLRCANTGISSIIAPSGKVEAGLGLDQTGFVEGKIAPRAFNGLTLFARWGNLWLLIPGLVLLGSFMANRRKAIVEKRSRAII
jgi:apolipoprotein N-acyltransferase